MKFVFLKQGFMKLRFMKQSLIKQGLMQQGFMKRMSSKFNPSKLTMLGSLKSRLLLGLSCALLLLAALVLGMAWQVGKTMVQETNMAHLRYEANLIADEITQQIDHRFQALERLSDVIGVSNNAQWLSHQLGRNDALLAWFDAVVISNSQGQVLSDWPVVEGRVGLETQELEYFKTLKGTRRPYVSEPFVGRASDIPMVLISVPRFDNAGQFAGFIGGVVSLDSSGLFNRLATIRLGSKGYAAVVTATGKVLYHPDRSLINNADFDSKASPLLDLALDGWQGDGVGRLLDGRMILPSNDGHLKNVIHCNEVNHGKIDDINEEKILYPLLRYLSARSVSAC